MAEYYLDDKGQIYADLAYRLGKIISQYDEIIPRNDPCNFDSSLCICILQNLLTIYDEMFSKVRNGFPLSRSNFYYNPNAQLSGENYLSLNKSMVLNDTFNKGNNVGIFLKHLRNSLSHPTKVNKDVSIPSTGYISNSDGKKIIHEYIFIDSPDTLNNSVKVFNGIDLFESYCKKNNYLFEKSISNGKITISNPRMYEIRLTTTQLKDLTLKLAKFIAQPIQKHWDGVTFNQDILNYAA
jgi:hypothetical protein